MDDWVLACRNVVLTGMRYVGRGRKTWGNIDCVCPDVLHPLGLEIEWA